MEEEWRDVVGYEGAYQVSNLGRVRSTDRLRYDGALIPGVMMKPYVDSCGYLYVGLSRNNKQKRQSIHRLVAKAFIPNPENLPQVNHKDEIRDHNSADNLEWCTILYNQNYGHRKERSSANSKGENNARAILTEKDVLEIRKTYIPGDKDFCKRKLSEKYGVSFATISKIVTGQLWKHLL